MGNYAVVADLKARFENDRTVAFLTDDTESGVPSTDVLDEVINHAEGEINSYAARKFLVPMDVSGDTGFAAFMRSLTLDIAVWRLVGPRGDIVSEPKQAAYDNAILWLEKLGRGDVEPPTPDTVAGTTSRETDFAYGVGATDSQSERHFTRSQQSSI